MFFWNRFSCRFQKKNEKKNFWWICDFLKILTYILKIYVFFFFLQKKLLDAQFWSNFHIVTMKFFENLRTKTILLIKKSGGGFKMVKKLSKLNIFCYFLLFFNFFCHLDHFLTTPNWFWNMQNIIYDFLRNLFKKNFELSKNWSNYNFFSILF